MKKSLLFLFAAFTFLLTSAVPMEKTLVRNSEGEDYPIYIVQPGDSLASIALEFGVDIDELIAVNDIENPNALAIGAELILPGLEGITGVLTTVSVQAGETLNTLSIRAGVSPEALMRINKLSSPAELYYNANIIIPLADGENENFNPITVTSPDSTLLEEAVKFNTSEWKLAADNQVNTTWSFLPNQVVFERTSMVPQAYISPTILDLQIAPDDIYQGNLLTITVVAGEGNKPQGAWDGKQLHFYPSGDNTFVALQGFGAMHKIGLNQLEISSQKEGVETYRFEQYLLTFETIYPSESIIVNPETIDEATQLAEDELIAEVVSQITEEKYWTQPFLCVVDQPACIRSWYGTNRNYNNSLYFNFHSGIDYGVCATLNIYAPADGVVAFTDSLIIRGNATYIDHGYGVYSAFFHQSEVWVEEGDFIQAGDIIGQIGTTGRSTGGHLHYDLIINGEQIDPLIWLPTECQ